MDGPHVLRGRGTVVALLSRSCPGAEGPLTEIAEPVDDDDDDGFLDALASLDFKLSLGG